MAGFECVGSVAINPFGLASNPFFVVSCIAVFICSLLWDFLVLNKDILESAMTEEIFDSENNCNI